MIDDDKDKDDFPPADDEQGGGPEKPRTESGYSEALEDRIQAFAEDISLDEALSKQASKKTDEERARERKFILWGVMAAAALLLLGTIYSCQPNKGSMAYGICSTLLELDTQYPETIRHSNLEGSRTTVRIYFTTTDAFGQYKLEMFECKFGPDEKMGMRVTDILRNRKSLGPQAVARANIALPTIISANPYRVSPPEWKNPLLPD